METKNIILKLRTERGMSQDELANKVMVTRQAVSRWENGDTVPNTDTLRLLSKEFDVSINTLLGEPRKWQNQLQYSHFHNSFYNTDGIVSLWLRRCWLG